MAIPQILHFTWKTAELPRAMQDYYERWRALHPGWDIRLWTDETMRVFVAENYPDFLAVYDAYPKPIQRADVFRYLVLGRLGGIYADLDVEPFQTVTPLLKFDAFLGVEPFEHVIADRIHQGVPFLFTNAFMGSVPDHPLWREVIAALPGLADQETFYSTGPSMVTAIGLRLPKADRPALLLPKLWSPLLATGLRTRGDARVRAMIDGLGEIVEAENGTLVSHKWMSTWVPWHKRGNRFAALLQIPTQLKWVWRQMRHRDLAAVKIADPLAPYTDQEWVRTEERPHVFIAVRLDRHPLSAELAAALAALDYPRERLSIVFQVRNGVEAALASAREAGLGEVIVTDADSAAGQTNEIFSHLPKGADKLLLIDGAIRAFAPSALIELLSARRPVVAANCVDEAGRNADPALFRYKDGGGFKVLYKDGGLAGAVRRDPAFRSYLGEQKVFAILPLDGVGESFVLVDRAVIAAGVRFTETPYKLHLGAEAFGIMARDRGFEVAGVPGVTVLRRT